MVRKKILPVRWDRLAKNNLDIIFEYIAVDSIAAARRVKKELVKLAHSLNDFPEKFSVEEFLSNEPENCNYPSFATRGKLPVVCNDICTTTKNC